MKNPKLGDRDQDAIYSQMKNPQIRRWRPQDEGYSQMQNPKLGETVETKTKAILR
jgi:hypothetical protein